MIRDYTATVFIVFNKKVLLLNHKKLKVWLPPGGHIEINELPQEAAIREVQEETGLNIKIETIEKLGRYDWLIEPPRHLLLEKIEPNHEHIDFIYFARIYKKDLDSELARKNRLAWFNYQEIKKLKTYRNVLIISKEAINALS